MIKFCMLSTKGGVGKTTLAASLGGLLADMGLRVLLIDADIQPSLSKYYPLSHQAPKGLTYVIDHGAITQECISHTEIDGLDIILSDDPEGAIQHKLATRADGMFRLSRALASPIMSDDNYDVVIIDTQGAAGHLQNNAALAASQIILPVVPETLAAREFTTGTMELLERLEVGPELGFRLGPVRAVLYKQGRTADAKHVAQALRDDFIPMGGRVTLLNTPVPLAKAYTEASTKRIPVHRHETRHPGAMKSASQVMHELVWELIPSLKDVYAGGFAATDTNAVPAAPATVESGREQD
ncbi:ParA family protein [Cupriavidus sp. YAF13]|uniref:ParA family protein n=1 Tax=Cupriavidus sp. YAF13 TaxID=3233075 RepID=UPI003F929002